MFGTFRYEPQNDNDCLQSSRYTPQHSACDTCRARKLKCGGQKNGCDRCKSTSIKCVYSAPGSSNYRRGKHTAASQHSDKSISSNSYRPSPRNRNSAPQYSQSANALESPTGAGPENDDGVEESTVFSENDTPFSTFASPMQFLEDDCIVSDHILQDLMPDLSTQSVDECLSLPHYPVQMSLDEYNYRPIDLIRTPEQDSMLSDRSVAFSAHAVGSSTLTDTGLPANAANSFTKAMRAPEPARPTSPFPPAAYHVQVDRLPSQHQLQDGEHSRRRSASACLIAAPALSTGQERRQQQHSQAQSVGWGSLPKDRSQPGACRCLQSIVGLLEELENRASGTDTQTLDSMLAYLKAALAHCSHMVRCPACSARSEYMMLLGVVSDKLITSYEQVITRHTESAQKSVGKNEVERGTSASSSSSSSSTALSLPGAGAGGDGGGRARVVFFGSYKIDGATEWEYVIRVLITLQLRQMFGLLARMQLIAEGTSRGPQVSALRMREQRLKNIMEKLKRFAQS